MGKKLNNKLKKIGKSWKQKLERISIFSVFFSPHYSDQMSEGSQVSKVTLCVKILKWQWLTHWPRSGIELPGQLKIVFAFFQRISISHLYTKHLQLLPQALISARLSGHLCISWSWCNTSSWTNWYFQCMNNEVLIAKKIFWSPITFPHHAWHVWQHFWTWDYENPRRCFIKFKTKIKVIAQGHF